MRLLGSVAFWLASVAFAVVGLAGERGVTLCVGGLGHFGLKDSWGVCHGADGPAAKALASDCEGLADADTDDGHCGCCVEIPLTAARKYAPVPRGRRTAPPKSSVPGDACCGPMPTACELLVRSHCPRPRADAHGPALLRTTILLI